MLGSADFLGLQLYTSNLVTGRVSPLSPSSYYSDRDVQASHDPSWKRYDYWKYKLQRSGNAAIINHRLNRHRMKGRSFETETLGFKSR